MSLCTPREYTVIHRKKDFYDVIDDYTGRIVFTSNHPDRIFTFLESKFGIIIRFVDEAIVNKL